MDTVDIEILKSLVWEAMRSKWKREGYYPVVPTFRASYDDICMSVAELAAQKKIIEFHRPQGFTIYSKAISDNGKKKIGIILWSLVAQEILYVENSSCLTFDITEYGEKVLKAEHPIPHDPEGYLAYLKSEVPDVDEVIYTYLSEGINAYNHRLYLSATTAIGCASEKALLLLIEAYISFLPSDKERDSFVKRTNGRQIKTQFEEFWKSFGGHKGELDKELTDGIDIVVGSVFELLRQNRNSTGHPTGKTMPKERVFASLQLFITYCKRIYGLIEFFDSKCKTK
ncbi:MAG: hypothetical protein IKM23_05230 [Bacteroidales bacterium]|nr:hypothetical protein [Bacteroidales bacterium]